MSADLASVTLRIASFVLLFQAVGVALFAVLFAAELQRSAGLIGAWGRRSAIGAIVLVSAHHALEAARLTGDWAAILDTAWQYLVLLSSSGAAFALRICGLLAVTAGLSSAGGRGRKLLCLSGAALVLLSFALVGHTAAHSRAPLLAVILLLHLLTIAYWFGALVSLHLALVTEELKTAARLTAKFSTLALRAVPAIAVAGLLLAFILLPDLQALRRPYGALLIVKLVLFAVLMGLAAINKLRLTPALAGGQPRAAQALHRSITAEYVLIACALGVSATMTTFYSPE